MMNSAHGVTRVRLKHLGLLKDQARLEVSPDGQWVGFSTEAGGPRAFFEKL